MTKRAEEDLLRIERHEHRIDAVDLHGTVGERTGAVVVAHRDGETELGHEITWNAEAGPHSTSPPAAIKRLAGGLSGAARTT